MKREPIWVSFYGMVVFPEVSFVQLVFTPLVRDGFLLRITGMAQHTTSNTG